ncbi:MAG TPA: hypothetical protein VIE38_03535 [Gaiellaceae bacterium]
MNEQLVFWAVAVDAVATAALAANAAKIPATAPTTAARLSLLDLSTELPPLRRAARRRHAAAHNVATLTDISLKGKHRDMLAAWT